MNEHVRVFQVEWVPEYTRLEFVFSMYGAISTRKSRASPPTNVTCLFRRALTLTYLGEIRIGT
jgi:hypothetical protein